MQTLSLRNDTLIEIATFLVRRWSGKENVTVEFSDKTDTKTRLKEKRVILPPIEKFVGDDFQRYRQFRATLWYEAMRIKFCKKILSNDHAFGFILNTIETRRIELLGRNTWKGMDEEIIFNYGLQWNYRPLLNSIYGKARIVEAFSNISCLEQLKEKFKQVITTKYTMRPNMQKKFFKRQLITIMKQNG